MDSCVAALNAMGAIRTADAAPDKTCANDMDNKKNPARTANGPEGPKTSSRLRDRKVAAPV
jgi:hypothetical protein